MSKYGRSVYGADLYGPDNSSLYSSGLAAKSTGYGKITLSWATPGSTWTRMRLVRNSYGYPAHGDDGVVLFDINSGPNATGEVVPAINVHTDTSGTSSKFYYYTLFVLKVVGLARTWQRTGDALGLSVGDKGYRDFLLQRLPGVLVSGGEVEGQPNPDTLTGRFFSLLGYDLAITREYLDHLAALRDPDLLHGNLVPSLTKMLGFDYEPEIGIRQNRVLARNMGYLNQVKGTNTGVQAMASALTGYGAEVLPLTNLCLDQAMSSFEGASLSPWAVVAPNGVATVESSGAPSPLPDASGSSFLQVVSANIGNTTLGHVTGSQGAPTYGIPVEAGAEYTASAYCSGFGSVAVDIDWFGSDGTLLSSTSSDSSVSASSSDWSARSSVTGTAPTTAVWAAVVLKCYTVGFNKALFVDAVQFEVGTSATDYVPARQVNVHLIAPRTNLMPNGGFDVDTAGWSSTDTLAYDTSTTFDDGEGSCLVTPSGSTSTITSPSFACNTEGDLFTVCEQVQPTVTADVSVSVSWYDAASDLVSTSTGAAKSCVGGAWTRLTDTFTAPAGAVTGILKVTQSASTAWYLDDVLVEQTGTAKPYFDASTNSGDVYYDGTISESPSHLYPNSLVMKARLLDWLPKYLAVGTSYAVTLP